MERLIEAAMLGVVTAASFGGVEEMATRVWFLFALESRDGKPLGHIFRDRRGYGVQYLDYRPRRARSLEAAKEKARRWMRPDDLIIPMKEGSQ